MSNDYFNHVVNRVPAATLARAVQINSIGDEIASGLDKLPSLSQLTRGTASYVADSGIADAYVVTFASPLVPTSYVEDMRVTMRPLNDNTGAATINVNGLGAKAIKRADGTVLPPKAIKTAVIVSLRYDAVAGEFRLISPIITVKNSSGTEVVVGR